MKAIIFDIDGTLADVQHRLHHLPDWNRFFAEMGNDPEISEVCWLADKLIHASMFEDADKSEPDFRVIVVSARPDDYRKVTQNWLQSTLRWYAWIDKIYMRKSGDFRQDSIVKAEILQQIIDDGYEPWLVIDDRPQVVEMWRSYGICTLQCAPDEVLPKHDGQNFLTMLVGPSGAGKSTWCELNAKPHDVISTDALREQYGWGHSPEDLNKTWNYAHSLMKARLENGIYTVFDATNLKKKDRLKLLSYVPKGQYVRYVVLDRPLDNKIRDRGWRPEELILKHHRTFQSQLKDILNGDGLPNIVVEDRRTK